MWVNSGEGSQRFRHIILLQNIIQGIQPWDYPLTVASRTLSHLSDLGWWLFYLRNSQNQIYFGSRCERGCCSSYIQALNRSKLDSVLCWYFHRFGLQANTKVGPSDFRWQVYIHASLCLCVCAFRNKTSFKTEPFIIPELICSFITCTFYGSWRIAAANIFGRKLAHKPFPRTWYQIC